VPLNANLLEQNVKANMIENCNVVRSAEGNDTGYLTTSDNGPWSVVHTGRAGVGAFGDTGAVQVPVTTLDAYCFEHLPNSTIDLIKIDVEGYEPHALAGAQTTIARWSPMIFMEFNSWCLILSGRNPLVFAQALWEAFSVESDSGVTLPDPIGFTHDNMVRHGCVEDIILRLRSPSALAFIDASDDIALHSEIDALRRSTSWRVTAPLRFIKSLLVR
jgi:FkbM family methyltransferase